MIALVVHLESAGARPNADTVTVLRPRWTLSLRTGRPVNTMAHGHDAGQFDEFDFQTRVTRAFLGMVCLLEGRKNNERTRRPIRSIMKHLSNY